MRDEILLRSARKVVNMCMGVRPEERVLILTDAGIPFSVSRALYEAALEANAVPVVLFTKPSAHPGGDPDEFACSLMQKSDVILSPTSSTIFHCPAAKKARQNGARIGTLTEIDEDVFSQGAIEADFLSHLPTVEKVTEFYTKGRTIHYRTPAGTDISASIEGRGAVANSSICHNAGEGQGILDIEVYIAPVEGSANGRLVIDASCSTIGKIDEPVFLTFEDGFVTRIDGGKEAEKLKNTLSNAGTKTAYALAEMAVGLNPNARVTGKVIEDEGRYGTCHCAVGANLNFGGANAAPIHVDMVQWHPTITIDGRTVFKNGELIC